MKNFFSTFTIMPYLISLILVSSINLIWAGCPQQLLDTLSEARTIKSRLNYKASHHEGDHWPVDGISSSSSYDQTFENVLTHPGFTALIRARKAAGHPTHVMDLFGSGVFLNSAAPIDSVTGVRLLHGYEHEGPVVELKKKWSVISGDLFREATWHDIREHLSQKNIEAEDIIVIRPVAGIMSVDPFSRGFHHNYMMMIRKAYRLLSREDGELYVQFTYLPENDRLLHDWIVQLNQAGFSAQIDLTGAMTPVRIVKTRNSPRNLPVPTNENLRSATWDTPGPFSFDDRF